MTILALTLSTYSAFATQEVLFDNQTMDQCRAEVNKLGCGNVETTDDEQLMKCVDLKKSKLTKNCQTVHNAMNEMRKNHTH